MGEEGITRFIPLLTKIESVDVEPFETTDAVTGERVISECEVNILNVAYDADEDVTWVYEFRAREGNITQYEPSLEQRAAANGQAVGLIFTGKMLDVHDLKEIIKWAMEGILVTPLHNSDEDYRSSVNQLNATLEEIYHELGGVE